jgi:tetratricopeptide (TPR) repeat protein
MKTVLAILLMLLLLLSVSASGEIQPITHTVKQPFCGSQSPDDARISAVAKATREVLEMAGNYIESLTVVKNSQVDKDEILALAAGVFKTEVVSQKNYASDDAFGIVVIVKVVVDTSVLEERVSKLLEDRTYLTQFKEAQNREKALLQKVAILEEENRKLMAKKQSTEKLKEQFQKVSRGLTAVDWLKRAWALRDGDKFTDPKKVLDYSNNAINLQKDYADAYVTRGFAYDDLGQYQSAIWDYSEAIRLKPDYAIAYYVRGVAYDDLGQYQSAIEDYNEAVRLKPDYAIAYTNRGNAYYNLGQHQRAIEDYNEVIHLKPDYAIAYNNRGLAYDYLGQCQRAIEDYNKAVRLKPDYAIAYTNRGVAYNNLGQYQRAIEDHTEAIRLKPDDAGPYTNRGVVYIKLGKKNLVCRDAQKACKLGNCKLLEYAKGKGDCR